MDLVLVILIALQAQSVSPVLTMCFFACCALPGVTAPVVPVVPVIPPIVITPPKLPPVKLAPLPPAPVISVPAPVLTTTTVLAKCATGSPWKNTAGADIYCGPGPNRMDCPTGSECIIGPNNIFAACCALAISSESSVQLSEPMVSDSMMSTTEEDTSMMPIDDSMMSEDELMANMIANATVRYLNIRLLEPTQAIAMWAAPNGTEPASYIAEISYGNNQWRALTLEEPDATFCVFTVTEKADFWIRVAPEGGIPVMETWIFQKLGKGKAGKAMSSSNSMN